MENPLEDSTSTDNLEELGKILDIPPILAKRKSGGGRKKGTGMYSGEEVTTLGLVLLFFIKKLLEKYPQNPFFKKQTLMKRLQITQYKIERTLRELRDKKLAFQEIRCISGKGTKYTLSPEAYSILNLDESKSRLENFLKNIKINQLSNSPKE